ncbi:MAG: anthranilate phosphoribosyltransferase [Solirubrobacteraceae bacterium]|nr:anthranilate phosphoribosyltransferase [Solirubrobacteraceae bacterium]
MHDLTAVIERLIIGESLSSQEAEAALDLVMRGQASEVQTAALLVALRGKGETRDELAGLVRGMRAHLEPVHATRRPLVDTAGSGGGFTTFNVSTAAALVAAGAGAAVAKHGNRSATSECGSADVLEALGVDIDVDPLRTAQNIDEIGFGFMFAPRHHPAMRHVIPVRRALGVHTIFNVLGPLTNPAGAVRQVIGVADPSRMALIAEALADLGVERAWVLRSQDGLDELSIAATSAVIDVRADGELVRFKVNPEEAGIERRESLAGLEGGRPAENAATIRRVFEGEPGPARDVVVLNAAATLVVAGLADVLAEGADLARQSIDTGSAARVLDELVAATTEAVA